MRGEHSAMICVELAWFRGDLWRLEAFFDVSERNRKTGDEREKFGDDLRVCCDELGWICDQVGRLEALCWSFGMKFWRVETSRSSFEAICVDLNWICGELGRLEALCGVLERFRAIYDELTAIRDVVGRFETVLGNLRQVCDDLWALAGE